MKNNNKKGISLIVLVITIIVIIVLAGAVILSLSANNPISKASKATYLSDVRNFQTELELYETKQFSDKLGSYNPNLLQADGASVTYDGVVDTSITMNDLIPTLGKATKYAGQFEVIDGKLVFQGSDTNKQDWTKEIGTEVLIAGEPRVIIVPKTETVVEPGIDMVYTVKYTSNAPITTIDLTDKIEILDNNGVVLSTQPVITIGTVSGSSSDVIRYVDVTIKTNTLITGSYKLKIKSGSVTNSEGKSSSQDITSLIGFDVVDNIPPENPSMSVNPTIWTNGNVLVTIVYSSDSAVKEYSLNGTTWNGYTEPVSVTENNTTVYARGKDTSNNESGVATLTVSNIERVNPTVVYGTNGATNLKNVSTTVTVSDAGGSSLNLSTLQYVWDTQNVTTPTSGWVTFTNGNAITKSGVTGTYYLWIKGSDNAGNSVTEKSNAFEIDNTAPINSTMSANITAWTNSDVTVTINYPADAIVKEYSTNGSTWTAYTSAVAISSNLTVYARGIDAAGNQSGQATLSITNIDKTVPTVAYGTNGATNVTTPSTTVTVSDAGGSAINTSTLQYVWDTQNVTTPTSGWATFTNGATLTKTAASGTYYLWIKVTDNAGNNLVSKTNAFTIQIVSVSNFNYTGSMQTFTVPYTGRYKLQVWGAQGAGSTGGKGGYTYGEINLTAGQTIYVYVGGSGDSGGWNGGGTGSTGNGGGATDIRNGGQALTNRIIVAGAGGGGYSSYQGGYGGGLVGQNAPWSNNGNIPTGGTQTSGGNWGGSFGQGGSYNYYSAGGGRRRMVWRRFKLWNRYKRNRRWRLWLYRNSFKC